MKMNGIVVLVLMFICCKNNNKTTAIFLEDQQSILKQSQEKHSVALYGKVILYSKANSTAMDTVDLKGFKINGLMQTDDYPSSQKDKSICKNWSIDEKSIYTIVINSKAINNSIWHYAYDHLVCNYKATITIEAKDYSLNINGGGWMSISTDSLEGKIGCAKKECLKYFLSEPINWEKN